MVEINKLLDIAFVFTALAGAVQLTSLIFQRSLTMYLARKRRITRLLANVSIKPCLWKSAMTLYSPSLYPQIDTGWQIL